MWRVIAGELRHRRARTLALLLGILVATTSFTVLNGTSESQRLDVRGTVNRNFRGTYDVLVRPRGSRSAFERRTGQVQPHFLSGVFGGISERQWRTVQRLPGVDVAAPIANLGYVLTTASVPIDLSAVSGRRGRTLLRARIAWRTDRGLTRLPEGSQYLYVTDRLLRNPGRGVPGLSSYRADALRERPAPGRHAVPVCPNTFYVDDIGKGGAFSWRARSGLSCFGRSPAAARVGYGVFKPRRPSIQVAFSFPLLLSAVDPVEEARLTHADRAVVAGRYLRPADRFAATGPLRDPVDGETYRNHVLPVLIANRSSLDLQADVSVERLSAAAARGMLRRHWSEDDSVAVLRYLYGLRPGRVVARRRVSQSEAYRRLLRAPRGVAGHTLDASQDVFRPDPVAYARRGRALAPAARPRPTNTVLGWDFTAGSWIPPATRDTAVRTIALIRPYGNSERTPAPELSVVGSFDGGRLGAANAPAAVPETVFQPATLTGRDAASARRLGGRPLLPDGNLAGYLDQPPGLLTTLRAARVYASSAYPQIVGAPQLSAIRVRVAGVTGADALSRERIRLTAERIATRTGLDVDIVAGASGAPTAVDLPSGRYGRPALALDELWIRKGVATTILTAIDRKSVALFTLILLVCALFVTNAASAAVRARRSELGVLACLGWTTGRLFAVVLGEVGAIGLVAGGLGVLLALPLAALVGVSASLERAALAVPAATLLALASGLVPAARAARADPAAAVRPIVLETRRAWSPRTIRRMALVNLLRTPGRTALGAFSLAIGVCALTLLLAATIAFHDTLVGTLLGDAVAIQVRGTDVIAVVAIVALGVASAADVLFLNLRERAAEFATLTAVGWDDAALTRLVGFEGLWIGALGALTGGAAGLAGATAFSGALPRSLVLTTLLATAAGVALAALAALAPAFALRRAPAVPLLAGE